MGGGQLVTLAAGEKDDPGHGGGHVVAQTADRGVGHLLHAGLLGARAARKDHVGLEQHAVEVDTVAAQRGEHGGLRLGGHLVAALDRVVTVHQHLRFDDRDEPGRLRQRREAG